MSPVIGAVLLVAVVVVLAGTVSYMVLGVETGPPQAPKFAKTPDYKRDTAGPGQALVITHESGEVADTKHMGLIVTGVVVREDGTDARVAGAQLQSGVSPTSVLGDRWKASEELAVDETVLEEEGGTFDASTEYYDFGEATVEIVWVPKNEGHSDVIFEWRGPEA
ncbi:MAG: type IV pilin [Haloarculaceae archaeon]